MRNPAAQVMTRVKDLNLPWLNRFMGLMNREFQDHKTGFVWVPAVFAGFMIFGFISTAVIGNSMIDEFGLLDHIQNGEITIDGKTFELLTNTRYTFNGDMKYNLRNTHSSANNWGQAKGHWWIAISGTGITISPPPPTQQVSGI